MQFHEWDFSPDLSTAEHVDSAESVRFTRAERSLLQTLISYTGRIWTRDHLLDAVSGIGSDVSDRSIDFLINRLRRKLRDSVRYPRYIETRYGEGYVWIAEPSTIKPTTHAALTPVRKRLRGSAIMSYCDRPDAERSVLHRQADSVLVLRLQGFLFFGAANKLLEEVSREVDGKLAYLIVDFRDVPGIDDTALPSFLRMERLASDHRIELVYSSVRPVIEKRLDPLDAHRFDSLDAALEWQENETLAATPLATAPAERTLAGYLSDELDDAKAATILKHFEIFDATPGTAVINAASHSRDMFFLESGTIDVVLDIDGAWLRVSRIWPGTLFGEIGFYCGGPRTATVRCLDECRLVRMDRLAVARLEADFPTLAVALYRFLARCSATRLIFYNDVVVDFLRSTRQ